MGLYARRSGVDFAGISAAMKPVLDQWYNGRIKIINPNITGGTYNRSSNTKSRTTEEVWSGPARIQAVRWPNVATTRQEAVSIRTVVFHLPLDAEIDGDMIREGWRVVVTDGGLSPHLTNGMFVITASVNTSYAWDRRIETVQDQGVSV